MVVDPHRWLELRRFRGRLESGAMSLSEISRDTGRDRKTVASTSRPRDRPRHRAVRRMGLAGGSSMR